MHWVQALISSAAALAEARRLIPSLVVCPLEQGLFLVPITEEVEQELVKSEFASSEPSPPPVQEIAVGVPSLAARLSAISPVVYAATFIHGGTGGQDALVWITGRLELALSDSEDSMSQWPNSPISRALRHVGVSAAQGEDEFDALGLGKHRSNEAWARAYGKAWQAG